MASHVVDLLDLAAAAVSSTVAAADQITQLASKTDEGKNVRLKADGSFVTDADLCAQSIIVQALQLVSPHVRLVGEESLDEMIAVTGHEERALEMYTLSREELTRRYDGSATKSSAKMPLSEDSNGESTNSAVGARQLLPKMEETVVSCDRVSVFIDPLDGTKAYAKGDYDPVSVLVAIILDEAPCFGVICKPFGSAHISTVLDTGCVVVYGGTLLGAAFVAGGGMVQWKPTATTEESGGETQLPRAVISSSRSGGVVKDVVQEISNQGLIHSEPLMISGAGEKSLRVILGTQSEGLWFFPKPGTSLWDVAASDALLRVTGGKLTDRNGDQMDYSKSQLEAENEEGVVASYEEKLHAECIRVYQEGNWDEPV